MPLQIIKDISLVYTSKNIHSMKIMMMIIGNNIGIWSQDLCFILKESC